MIASQHAGVCVPCWLAFLDSASFVWWTVDLQNTPTEDREKIGGENDAPLLKLGYTPIEY
jgi:hypothetical protein